jgi:uncharacterized protein
VRAVLDTNVLISSLFWGGLPRRLTALAAAGGFRAVTSPELLAELATVLVQRFGWPSERAAGAAANVASYSEVITVIPSVDVAVRDPADVKVVACACAAEAECIVSGDRDLLELGEVRGVPVVTVREFLDRFATA